MKIFLNCQTGNLKKKVTSFTIKNKFHVDASKDVSIIFGHFCFFFFFMSDPYVFGIAGEREKRGNR